MHLFSFMNLWGLADNPWFWVGAGVVLAGLIATFFIVALVRTVMSELPETEGGGFLGRRFLF